MKNLKEIFEEGNSYFSQANIGGLECTVGYIKKFKWRWMATQLNTFIIVAETEMTIDKKVIEDFSAASFDYALKNNQGWPRGLQSGIGSIAILKGNSISADAIKYCEKPSKKHFSAFEIPVLYDTTKKEVIKYRKKPIWGTIYFSFFTETIAAITRKF